MISNPIGSVDPAQRQGLPGFASQVINSLKREEMALDEAFSESLRPDGSLMKMPEHMTERFRKWEEMFSAPEDLAKIAEVKGKVTAIMEGTSNYIRETVERRTQRVQLEIAMKAVSKGTQSIQQILSSQ